MKKSINIGLILFLLLQACSSSENTENQASVEPISEDTPINEPAEPNNPPLPGDDNASPKDDNGQDGGPTVNEALTILENVSDDVIRCIDNDVYGLYDQYLNGYIPDEYEAKVVVTCFNNPEAYGPMTEIKRDLLPENQMMVALHLMMVEMTARHQGNQMMIITHHQQMTKTPMRIMKIFIPILVDRLFLNNESICLINT
jgi:hypothetical protein